MATGTALRHGPRGLGTSAARPPGGRVSVPPLYGPGPVRVDEALGEEVDARLVAWLSDLGIFLDKLDRLREARFGRLAMLVHPDTDDPDRLLLAARLLVAFFAVDDVYMDDTDLGAVPELVGGRLALAQAALDPPRLGDPYGSRLQDGLETDPVLIALRSSVEWLARNGAPSQVDRVRYEAANLFAGMNAEASWRIAGHVPPVWEYLAGRHLNSFMPNLTLVDLVGGYHLAAELYSDPRVRRASTLAGDAATIANDLYSLAKDRDPRTADLNLPVVIALEERCSLQEAVERSVAYHTGLVKAFESAHRGLAPVASPELQRYLLGLRAWIGGSDEWHRSSGRYRIGGAS